MSPISTTSQEIYDVFSVGFGQCSDSNVSCVLADDLMFTGPAGLSIAIAIHDNPDAKSLKAHYIEAQPEYAWHPGMLIPGYKVNRVPSLHKSVTLFLFAIL